MGRLPQRQPHSVVAWALVNEDVTGVTEEGDSAVTRLGPHALAVSALVRMGAHDLAVVRRVTAKRHAARRELRQAEKGRVAVRHRRGGPWKMARAMIEPYAARHKTRTIQRAI
jgi:hypothetical protein